MVHVSCGDGSVSTDPSIVLPVGRAPGRDCRYTAIVDRTHPCFFDHPLDHLPGALVIEVYRQAAIAAAASDGVGEPADAVVTRCAVQLSDFAELRKANQQQARESVKKLLGL